MEKDKQWPYSASASTCMGSQAAAVCRQRNLLRSAHLCFDLTAVRLCNVLPVVTLFSTSDPSSVVPARQDRQGQLAVWVCVTTTLDPTRSCFTMIRPVTFSHSY